MTDRAFSDPASDPAAAAAAITQATGVAEHDVAVVLGSGWRPAADVIGPPAYELAMADIPGFVRPSSTSTLRSPTVTGHGGTVRSVPVGRTNPGRSAIASSCAGGPITSAAGRHPEPSTTATSCAATPVACVIAAAAAAGSDAGSEKARSVMRRSLRPASRSPIFPGWAPASLRSSTRVARLCTRLLRSGMTVRDQVAGPTASATTSNSCADTLSELPPGAVSRTASTPSVTGTTRSQPVRCTPSSAVR